MSIADLVAWANGLPPEAVWLAMLVACFLIVLGFLRAFGAAGLQAYVVIGIIGANVQVLKPVQFSVFADPVALGTILFASTYLATDVLSEHYGPAQARKAVWMGFAGLLAWVVLMLLTLGFRPLTPEEAGEGLAWALGVNDAMATLFLPAPIFLIAGMTAYLISQHHDVWLYALMRRLTGNKRLWLRNNVSTWVSALIDNTIFSLLAWIVLPIVFGGDPLPFDTVLLTYILGTYGLRVAVALLDTPFVYAASWLAGRRREAERAFQPSGV